MGGKHLDILGRPGEHPYQRGPHDARPHASEALDYSLENEISARTLLLDCHQQQSRWRFESSSAAWRFQDLYHCLASYNSILKEAPLTHFSSSYRHSLFILKCPLTRMCVEVLDKAVGVLDRNLGEPAISMEDIEEIALASFFRKKITYILLALASHRIEESYLVDSPTKSLEPGGNLSHSPSVTYTASSIRNSAYLFSISGVHGTSSSS